MGSPEKIYIECPKKGQRLLAGVWSKKPTKDSDIEYVRAERSSGARLLYPMGAELLSAKRGLERYPVNIKTVYENGGGSFEMDINLKDRRVFIDGYEQAQKDGRLNEEDLLLIRALLAKGTPSDAILRVVNKSRR